MPLIQICVKEARDLRKADKLGKSDPYCTILLGTQKFKTAIKKTTLAPQWNEWFIMDAKDLTSDVLVFRVYDWDALSSADKLGHICISLLQLSQKRSIEGWYELAQTTSGDLHIIVNLLEEELDDPMLTIKLMAPTSL